VRPWRTKIWRLLRSRCDLFVVEIFRKLEWFRGTLFHGPLDGFLVSTQGFAANGVFQVASFNIQQNLYLPRLEGVTVHRAAQKIVHKLVESAKNGFAIKSLYRHIQQTYRQIG
jgi:hypothetical protein